MTERTTRSATETRTATGSDWNALAARILEGEQITEAEALSVLHAPDSDVPGLLAAAWKLRSHHFGNTVKLNYLVNAKSGLCPEDCTYCTQSKDSTAEIEQHRMLSQEQIIAKADHAHAQHAGTCCIVISAQSPTDQEVDHVAGAVQEIKRRHPEMKVCACMGILKDGQAEKLAAAGADRYNHNLNTAESHYEEVCSTHSYQDRLDTVEASKKAGISPCSGVIVGMGESREQVVESAYALKRLDVDSIPVNFFLAVEGTPLGDDPEREELDPRYCLKVLCMYRFVNPAREIRVSAGREEHLRTLQPMSLYAANAMFLADYLTEPGQAVELDEQMIEDLGFVWEQAGGE
ncbi:biotin synthase BioB [bacterium]|nr:MAG: biotin synthase BioB [bacterium]